MKTLLVLHLKLYINTERIYLDIGSYTFFSLFKLFKNFRNIVEEFAD